MSENLDTATKNVVDFESGVPLHLQVREIIRQEAINGELIDENGKMPTEAELVKRFGVSRVTVRNALQTLVEEGMLVRERGRGTFLKTNSPENWVGRLMGFTETIKEAGYQPGARILVKGMTNKFPQEVKNELKLNAVWELKRLRLADDIPIAIEHAFYPPEIGLELEGRDLENMAIYRFFEEELQMPLKEASQMISAVKANDYEAKKLGIDVKEPLLYIERITYSKDQQPAEFLMAVYRPDYYQYMVSLTRKGTYKP